MGQWPNQQCQSTEGT